MTSGCCDEFGEVEADITSQQQNIPADFSYHLALVARKDPLSFLTFCLSLHYYCQGWVFGKSSREITLPIGRGSNFRVKLWSNFHAETGFGRPH
jgi:hypothetical protein